MKNRETNLTHRMVNRLTPPRVCVYSAVHIWPATIKWNFVYLSFGWLNGCLKFLFSSIILSLVRLIRSHFLRMFFFGSVVSFRKSYHCQRWWKHFLNRQLFMECQWRKQAFCGMETSATDWIWKGKNAARIQWKKLFWKCHRSNRIG